MHLPLISAFVAHWSRWFWVVRRTHKSGRDLERKRGGYDLSCSELHIRSTLGCQQREWKCLVSPISGLGCKSSQLPNCQPFALFTSPGEEIPFVRFDQRRHDVVYQSLALGHPSWLCRRRLGHSLSKPFSDRREHTFIRVNGRREILPFFLLSISFALYS